MAIVGIIGGSGLENPDLLADARELDVDTRFGKPSSTIMAVTIAGVEVAILSRHGRDHAIMPTRVPNRANVQALVDHGCTHVLATTAVGSLREHIGRGDFIVPDQFIDFTRRREVSMFDDFSDGLHHTPMADPFDAGLRAVIIETAASLGIRCHAAGTVVTIEGPRFSTRAESRMFRAWSADVINMSTAPECIMMREAGLPYAAVAMATDYDSWKDDENPVSWEAVLSVFKDNAERMTQLLAACVPRIEALSFS